MECANCASTEPVAYTLKTYVQDSTDGSIDLHFCSSDCLTVWT